MMMSCDRIELAEGVEAESESAILFLAEVLGFGAELARETYQELELMFGIMDCQAFADLLG